jgi:flavin-dependent dehydrogenase
VSLEAYDVAILGGGPAGAAAALSLRRLRPALRIRMVEASRYAEWRVGETLAPGTQQLLTGLGCWDRFLAERFAPSYGTRAAWGAAEAHDNEFLLSARGDGWHVDRVRFDAMLCACVREAGVEVTESARLSDAHRVDDAGWSVAIRGAAGREEFRARFVVDATGRSAAFATGQGARRMLDDRLVGVFVLFRFPVNGAAVSAYTLVEAHPDGWWYSSITPDSRAVVAWMSDASLVRRDGLHLHARWMERLGSSRETAARVAGATVETAPVVWAAHSQRLSQCAGAGWVAAGDAACTFDPLSSQGILKALRGGKLASFVALDWLEGRTKSLTRYERIVGAEYREYFAARAWCYGQEQRWPHSEFWRVRHENA